MITAASRRIGKLEAALTAAQMRFAEADRKMEEAVNEARLSRQQLDQISVKHSICVEEIARLKHLLAEQARKLAQMLSLELKNQRQEHFLEVIDLIANGNGLAAVQALMRKDEFQFNIEFRVASESAEKASEEGGK